MTPREIIAQAWAITTKTAAVRRWSFVSSLFETMLNVKLLIYQVYFAFKYIDGSGGAGFFDIEIMIYQSMPFWLFLSIVSFFVTLIVVELFIPHFCTGAIIGLAAKSYRGEPVKGGLVLGLYNFFPIFAIHEFLGLAGLSIVITVFSLILRYVSGDIKYWCIGVLAFLFLLSNVLKFLFSFANEGVVLQKLNIFHAIGRSFKLIMSHLSHIMFLLLLLFVISIRILLNVATVILVPAIVVGIAVLLTHVFSQALAYSIAAIVGIALIIIASYFFAYVHAFKHCVWTITYLELTKHKDLDVIL